MQPKAQLFEQILVTIIMYKFVFSCQTIFVCVCGVSSVVLVWPNEWQSLQQWYTSEDKQVCLLKVAVQDSIQYTSSPGESEYQRYDL